MPLGPIAFEQHLGAASAPLAQAYRPRQLERTILHKVVCDNLETMLAQARERSEHGFGYPRFVEKAFRAYLSCGQLPAGFARIKCRSCGYERLLAFSCKSRLCPSCHARRMHDTSLHLLDHVLPRVPWRQWVFTLPRPVRLLMARDKNVLGAVLNIFIRALFGWQRGAARADGYTQALPGAVAFVQFFGSAINLNVHFHVLAMDGVFVDYGAERSLVLLELMAPSQAEVETLLCKLAEQVSRLVATHLEEHDLDQAGGDALGSALALCTLTPGSARPAPGDDGDHQEQAPHRCAAGDGFSLHANVALAADDRQALLRLCRYGARQAFSQKQLSALADGRLCYQLKRPWGPHGQSAIVLEPSELLHRLAALLPPPYLNCTRYFGVFAPNASRRHEVCPGPPMPKRHSRCCSAGQAAATEQQLSGGPLPRLPPSPPPHYRIPWAELLKRTWNADVLSCPRCHGQLKIIAFITELALVHKILAHLRLPTELPEPLPARLPPQLQLDLELGDQQADCCEPDDRSPSPRTALARPRAPP